MAIQFVGGTTGNLNSSTSTSYSVSLTSLTGGLASSPQSGDLIVVTTGFSYFGDIDPGVTTSGYTEVADLYQNDTRDANLAVAYKVAGSSETSVTVTACGNTNYGNTTVVMVFRGVDGTTPLDVTHTTASAGNASRANSPAITPVTAGSWIVACGLGTGDTTPTAFTGPSGMAGFSQQAGTGGTASATAGMAYFSSWTSGAYDPAAWTGGESTTSDSWAAVTLALREAVIIIDGAAGLSGSGTLGAAGTITRPGAATLAGSSTLSAEGLTSIGGASSLSGAGSFAAVGDQYPYSGYYKRITEDGNFRVTEDNLYRIDETLNLIIITGDAAFTGTGTLSVAGSFIHSGLSDLAGSGVLSAAGSRSVPGASSLAGSGSLAAAGTRSVAAIITLAGSGALSAAATRSVAASAGLSGTGTISAAATKQLNALAALAGSSSFTSSGNVVIIAEADFTAAGSMSVRGLLTLNAASDLLGPTTLIADGQAFKIGVIYVKKLDGTWGTVKPYVFTAGQWRECDAFVRTNGNWKQVYINGN